MRAFRLFIVLAIVLVPASFAIAQKTARHESAATPEKNLSAPLVVTTSQSWSAPSAFSALAVSSSLGPNLIQNPSVETVGTNGLPIGWAKGGYGTNTRTLTYPVTGTCGAGTKAVQVTLSNYA